MAHSLSEECTPLKREYDSCFNAWFEGYLEPAVAASPAQREQYSQEKAREYDENCGKIWSQYRECVQVMLSILLHHGILPELTSSLVRLLRCRRAGDFDQARAENPLKEPPPVSSVDKTSSS
ncbi:hypothetical protein EIP91_000530 [Steccherinum ochraceum]|uniref:Mitochondrial distribution and morphology protein 35 n=1 Tax=Steccherinum ochraceum TaxID=92696 RepID=A0A4R0RQJ2_9APHY|nr:hypothetical protein EIP91_000530 [Steccherinum ochraceum]